MANVQTHFNKFHDTIRRSYVGRMAKEKRQRLKALREQDPPVPSYTA